VYNITENKTTTKTTRQPSQDQRFFRVVCLNLNKAKQSKSKVKHTKAGVIKREIERNKRGITGEYTPHTHPLRSSSLCALLPPGNAMLEQKQQQLQQQKQQAGVGKQGRKQQQ